MLIGLNDFLKKKKKKTFPHKVNNNKNTLSETIPSLQGLKFSFSFS